MKEQKKLTIKMAIFTFIIFVCFGIIILNEKSAPYYASRIHKKLLTYLNETYKDEINRLKAKKVKVNNNKENIQTENNKIEINKEFLSKKRKITYTNTSCVFKQKIKN